MLNRPKWLARQSQAECQTLRAKSIRHRHFPQRQGGRGWGGVANQSRWHWQVPMPQRQDRADQQNRLRQTQAETRVEIMPNGLPELLGAGCMKTKIKPDTVATVQDPVHRGPAVQECGGCMAWVN